MAERGGRPHALAALARELSQEPDLAHIVQRVVDTVATHLGSDISSSVSLVRRKEVETPAASDKRAVRADQLQYELGQGPCLHAISKQGTCAVDDLTADDQYPVWSRRAAHETGFRSALSVHLFVEENSSLGALNLFSPHARAFDPQTRDDALAFAALTAVAVRRGKSEENLRTAMATRTLVGQAQGILMERLRITPDAAFAILSRQSQDTNTKVREVARRLIDTGEIPRRGRHSNTAREDQRRLRGRQPGGPAGPLPGVP